MHSFSHTIRYTARALALACLLLLLPACLPALAVEPAAEANPAAPTAPPPTVTASPAPSATPRPTATPTPSPAEELAALAAAQRPARDPVLLTRALTDRMTVPHVARTRPLDVEVGHAKDFWVLSMAENTNHRIRAELRYAGPVVLMYVEQGAEVNQQDLEAAAREFETQIYPRTRELFGSEWQPGVDGDPRIVILNARTIDGGVAGYFSPRDSLPLSVNRFSNEHEMFYMNVAALSPGSTAYIDTLAHEFQHMIHWNEQRRSSTWFNEGNSTLSEDLNGFLNQRFVNYYLHTPDTQLNAWGDMPASSLAHYGAAQLFLRYIYAHYSGDSGLVPLIRADAGNDLAAFVQLAAQTRPDIDDFGDLFAEWALANLLNNPQLAQGQYAYQSDQHRLQLLTDTVTPAPLPAGSHRESVQQFGADYWQLPAGPLTLTFTGTTSVNLVGTQPQGSFAWWSGRGDNSIATLTRVFDLREASTAHLRFSTWYEIEQSYDYAFVSVSTDGGTRWHALPGIHTTSEDPHGANYGHGLTGVSGLPGQPTSIEERGHWLEEAVDLTPYVGQEILVRFWQINDEGFNAPGILIDNIRIPEIDYSDDVEAGAGGWQAQGFVRVDGDLAQSWELRLVRTAADGSTSIEPLPVDAAGNALLRLAAGESGVLLVAATTPHTTEPARYEVTLRPQP